MAGKITVLKSDMQDKSYTLSGSCAFIHRYADTGFRTKWCGVWMPPYKFFEYFAFKVNETWLSPSNVAELSLEKGAASHTFAIEGIDLCETLFVPKKLPAAIVQLVFKNTTDARKNISLELEAAINIRTKAENIHTRGYETDFSKKLNAVIAKSDGKSAAFGIGKTGKKMSVEFLKNESYKEHSPGGELQRCFIPGIYKVSFGLDANEELLLPFVFAGSFQESDNVLHSYELCFHDARHTHVLKHPEHNHMHSEINTPDAGINDAYAFSASNIFGLIYESSFGKGFFAGYPWFLEFWGRDTFWSIKGLVDLGEFQKAKEIMKTMAQFQKERIPCLVNPDASAKYYAADVDALFLAALDYYIEQSGDSEAENEFKKNIDASIASLRLKKGLSEHAPNETWMDSLSREGTAVEIQSLWIEALKKKAPEKAKEMLSRLNDSFWNEETRFLDDTSEGAKSVRKTSNALVPLMFGQIEKKRAIAMLKTAKSELFGPYGISTLSRREKNYSPSKYHEGASWGLATAIGACAFSRYGMPDDAARCLKAMASDVRRHMLGGMSECLNSETGELLGCGMQLWSAALYIHAIDRHLFGIYSDDGKIAIKPEMPSGWRFVERKNKKLGKEVFDVSIVRAKNRYEFDIRFRGAPEKAWIRITLPEDIKDAQLNSKPLGVKAEPGVLGGLKEMLEIKEKVVGKFGEISANTVEFRAEKSNTLVIRTI